jgi:hypothetical protein
MLPNSHQSTYFLFRQQILGIKAAPERKMLKSAVQNLHQTFAAELKTLNLETLEPTLESRVRSLWVEIDKQLRLLSMDATFLQTARQPETIEARSRQIDERLDTLIQYCNILLGETSSHP